MDIFDQIATGVRPPTTARSGGASHSYAQLQLGYALAKQVPDMARGFTIQTGFGEIAVVAGPLADQLQTLVREAVERELAAPGAQQ